MQINPGNLAAMFDGFNTRFNQAFEGAQSAYERVSTVMPSTGRNENYGWLAQIPGFREWIGPRVLNSLTGGSYTIKNVPFESTISVSRDDIEDDQYGIFGPLFSEMGRRSKQHPDELIFSLIKNGFVEKGYDGQFFFDTQHPVGNGVSIPTAPVANTDGGDGPSWFLLDTSRAIRPFIFQLRRPYNLVAKSDDRDENVFMLREFVYGVDARCNAGFGLWQLAWGSQQALDASSYETARKAMMSFTDDHGKLLGVVPDTLVCGPSNEKAALSLLNAATLANGASNVYANTAKLIVTPYLD